jgi:hypothetical protein
MFKVKLQATNFFANDIIKINNSVKYIEEYFNSDEFKAFVKDFAFVDSNEEIIRKFHYTGLSNEEVLNKILSGSETLTPEADGEADLQVELDTSWTRNVIGYTYPTTPMQWIYAKFFHNWSEEEICGNIAHEYMHKLGFDHEYKWTHDREFSVPYAVGYACEAYAKRAGKKSYFERFKAFFAS